MPRIDIATMRGEVPRVAAHLLPDDAATLAKNCHFDSGIICPIFNDADTGITLPAEPKTLFRYRDNYWLQWSSDVDVIPSPLARDPYGRVYYTDGDYPKVTTEQLALGSGVRPTAWYRLGLDAPGAVAVGAITPPDGGTDDTITDDETRYYVQTWVTSFGEEGPPSEASLAVEIPIPGSTVALTFASPANNDRNITHRRLYRSVTGSGASDFLLVAELPIATLSHTDAVPSGEEGAALETYDYLAPPDSLSGLCLMANGIAAGFSGNEVLFSEAYLPYAWPQANRHTTKHDIVAVAPIGTALVVATKGYPYLFSGVTPSAINGQRLDVEQACVSKGSIVVLGGNAIYASPDGLVAVGGNGAQVITASIITRQQWQAMNPETIKAWPHEGKYVAVSSSHAFIFDPVSGDFRHFDATGWNAAHHDLEEDCLYIAKGTNLYQWRTGADLAMAEWASKVFRLPPGSTMSAARLIADDISQVALTLSIDGVVVMTIAKGNVPATGFRLPAVRGQDWQVSIQAQTKVSRLVLATSMMETA